MSTGPEVEGLLKVNLASKKTTKLSLHSEKCISTSLRSQCFSEGGRSRVLSRATINTTNSRDKRH